MKKGRAKADKHRSEYKRSDFEKLERGKCYERVKASSNVVILDADVAKIFLNSAWSTRRCIPSSKSRRRHWV